MIKSIFIKYILYKRIAYFACANWLAQPEVPSLSRSPGIFHLLVIQFVWYLWHHLNISYYISFHLHVGGSCGYLPPLWWLKSHLLLDHFRVHFSLYFKASLHEKFLLWISVLIHIETSRTICHNNSQLDSLWKRGWGELANALFSASARNHLKIINLWTKARLESIK